MVQAGNWFVWSRIYASIESDWTSVWLEFISLNIPQLSLLNPPCTLWFNIHSSKLKTFEIQIWILLKTFSFENNLLYGTSELLKVDKFLGACCPCPCCSKLNALYNSLSKLFPLTFHTLFGLLQCFWTHNYNVIFAIISHSLQFRWPLMMMVTLLTFLY